MIESALAPLSNASRNLPRTQLDRAVVVGARLNGQAGVELWEMCLKPLCGFSKKEQQISVA